MENWPKFQPLPKNPWLLSCCDRDPPSTQWVHWFAAGRARALTGPPPSCFLAPQRFCVELHSLPLLKCNWVVCGFHSTHISHCIVICLEMSSHAVLKVHGKGSTLQGQGYGLCGKEKQRPQKEEACKEHRMRVNPPQQRHNGWFPASLHFLRLLSKFWQLLH